jgi:hypothetical protein
LLTSKVVHDDGDDIVVELVLDMEELLDDDGKLLQIDDELEVVDEIETADELEVLAQGELPEKQGHASRTELSPGPIESIS